MKKNKVVVASKPAPSYGGNKNNSHKSRPVRTKESTKRQAMLNWVL